MLQGELDQDELVLPGLHESYSCVGGPRLQKGDRVLLLLGEDFSWIKDDVPMDVFWSSGPTGGNVILSNGRAFLDDYETAWTGDGYLGTGEEVVLYVADQLGASEESTNAALAALGKPARTYGHGFDWALPATALIVGVWTALAAVVFFRMRRTHSA